MPSPRKPGRAPTALLLLGSLAFTTAFTTAFTPASTSVFTGAATAGITARDPEAGPRTPREATDAMALLPEESFGIFLGSGPEGIRRSAYLPNWLGGTRMNVGRTYLPGDLWSNIEGRPAFLRPWAEWRRADPGRLFALNVPMLERNEAGVPDAEVRRLLRLGARGAFDRHFRVLAERLVALGLDDTIVVLGWEMNGTTYTHRCGPDPDAWRTYWRRIVTAMREVPGQRFRFDWAPNRGRDALDWTRCYPGDDVVDIIGLDTYDQPPGSTFDEHVRQPYGLQDHVDFAASRGKPVSFPEWGLFRNGDNPEYMRRMLAWIAEHRPVYHSISDYCPHGIWRCPRNPASAELFRAALTADGDGGGDDGGAAEAPEGGTAEAPEGGTEPRRTEGAPVTTRRG